MVENLDELNETKVETTHQENSEMLKNRVMPKNLLVQREIFENYLKFEDERKLEIARQEDCLKNNKEFLRNKLNLDENKIIELVETRNGFQLNFTEESKENWKKLEDCDSEVLKSILSDGYQIPFQEGGLERLNKLTNNGKSMLVYRNNLTVRKEPHVQDEIENYLVEHSQENKKHFTELKDHEILDKSKCLIINPLSAVLKPDGTHRLVLDPSRWQDDIVSTDLKPTLNTFERVIATLKQNSQMFKLDLTDGYWIVRIPENLRKYFVVQIKGRYFQHNILPFGMKYSAWLFIHFLNQVLRQWKKENPDIMCESYVDDILNYDDPLKPMDKTLPLKFVEFLQKYQFQVNFKKSYLEPSLIIPFLGKILDTYLMVYYNSPSRILNIKKRILETLSKKEVSMRELAKLIGKINFAIYPNKKYALLSKNLYVPIKRMLNLTKSQNYDVMLSLSERYKGKLKRVHEIIDNVIEPIGEIEKFKEDITIYTDAATSNKEMIGAYVIEKESNEIREYALRNYLNVAKMRKSKYLDKIAILETDALFITLRNEKEKLKGKNVEFKVDNSVLFNAMRGKAKNKVIANICVKIFNMLFDMNIKYKITLIKSEENLADKISREPVNYDKKVCELENGKMEKIEFFARKLKNKNSETPIKGKILNYTDHYHKKLEKLNTSKIFKNIFDNSKLISGSEYKISKFCVNIQKNTKKHLVDKNYPELQIVMRKNQEK